MSRTIYAAPNDGFRVDFGPGKYVPMFWCNQSHIGGGLKDLNPSLADLEYLGLSVRYGHPAYQVWGNPPTVKVPAKTPLCLDVAHYRENRWSFQQCSVLCAAVKYVAPDIVLTGYHEPLQPLNDKWDMTLTELIAAKDAVGAATYDKYQDLFPIRMPFYSQPEERKKQFDILPGMANVASQYAARFGPGKKVVVWTWATYRDGMPIPPGEMDEIGKLLMTLPGISGVIGWDSAANLPALLAACGKYQN